ncbi:MAG: UDP-N-acetylglucosamine 1-carboxyvinyltransferase [Clostridia bacterium]|nr:UDP-N-acetylglucosamine 1-carboxyvinyltransferase [Clostridia bacterium]
MREYKIYGGVPLEGRVQIGGAKNGALPLLFAALLAEGESVFYNMPDIGDVRLAGELLCRMGARVVWRDPHTVSVCRADFSPDSPDARLTGKIRASSYLLGLSLGGWGRASAPATGGCNFGNRPLNCHYDLFHALGATGDAALSAPRGLHGGTYTFPFVSVGATVNALLVAARLEETVELFGCATEPHVVDLERYLLLLGVRIEGVGTPHLTLRGSKHLVGHAYGVAPDDIEAGTYLLAACATRGRVELVSVTPRVLAPLLAVLEEGGCRVTCGRDSVLADAGGWVGGTVTETAPFPGFPTDLQPPLVAALCFGTRAATVRECVWANRFRYTAALEKMGARMDICGDTLTVFPTEMHPASMEATDLRGGAAMVIAALAARGRSTLEGVELIERGYENLPRKLRGLGAEIL